MPYARPGGALPVWLGDPASYPREALVAEEGRNQPIDDVRACRSFEKIEEASMRGASIDAEPATSAGALVGNNEPKEPSYNVGYKRPPRQTRIKPGERRNPKGRPRGSPNQKTAILRALKRKVPAQRGEKTSMVPVMEAMTEIFAGKAVEGDRYAAGVIINLATKAGILDGRKDATENEGREVVGPAAVTARPSDAVLEGVNPELLSEEEQIDLSRIAEKIDNGGHVIALGGDEFARLKKILAKGRGTNVGPQVDDKLDEAA